MKKAPRAEDGLNDVCRFFWRLIRVCLQHKENLFPAFRWKTWGSFLVLNCLQLKIIFMAKRHICEEDTFWCLQQMGAPERCERAIH